jgi:chemotaxis protein methyltransferase CheR
MLNLSDDEFKLFANLLVEEAGLHFSADRIDILQLALEQRVKQKGYSAFNEYYNFLKYHPEGSSELKNLIELLTVGETYFFRSPAQFDALKDKIIPEIVNKKLFAGRTLRIWSAGCSTGEEPYTLAMILLNYLPASEAWNISIVATDINRNVLSKAREGIYSQRSVEHVPPEFLEKYFTKQGNKYVLSDEIKKMVNFSYHNLVKEFHIFDGAQDFDIIFCRNVTIYFKLDTIKTIIEKFYHALINGGYLFLGYSETLWQISEKFRVVEFPHTFVYQKVIGLVKEEVHPFVNIPDINIDLIYSVKTDISPAHTVKYEAPRITKEEIDVKKHLGNALLLANQGMYENAILDLKKIINYDNLSIEAYYLMGVLYEKIGKYEDAIREYRKVIYVNHNTPIAYYNLGNIYFFQKKHSNARREYQNAIRYLMDKAGEEVVQFAESLTCELLLIACKRGLEEIDLHH